MRWLVPLALVAALVAGCTSTVDDDPVISPPSGTASAAVTPSAAASAGATTLRWSGCGDGFQCATLRVPLDHAEPTGQQLSLAVVRLPAGDRAHRLGSLVINPGGPGGSGVDYARAAQRILPAEIRERFDIVGFDPRGVGGSRPAVDCIGTAEFHRYLALDPTPDDGAEAAADVSGEKAFADGCAQDTGRDLLAHMSTVDAARDMDDLRAALGDAKLTYLGKSYGTFLGATYAELFPAHVRAMVLDGVLDPTLSAPEFDRVQALGFEQSLQDFLRYCTAHTGCGLGESSDPAVLGAALDRLLAAIDAHPLPDRTHPGRTAGPGEAGYALGAGLYSTQYGYPALAAALTLAQRGRGDGLVALADSYADAQQDGSYGNELEANAAVNCVDRPPYPGGAGGYTAARERLAAAAPHFGALNVLISSVCAYWPVPPTGSPHPIHATGSPPLLLIGGTGDPATPYRWATSLDRQLDNDVLLTYHGSGHTVYGDGTSACVDHAVDAYLLSLTMPAPGTTCS